MALFEHVRLWGDVLDEALDELQAPELDYLVLGDPRLRVYTDAGEFFRRTLVTPRMLEVLEGVVEALEGGGRHVYVLHSFFGGGKTHTLFTVYHAVRSPGALLEAVEASARDLAAGERVEFLSRGRRLVERLRRLRGVRVVLVSGKIERFFPTPSRPQRVDGVLVRTLWGYLAARLGRYGLVELEDKSVRAPAIDRLVELIRGVPVLVLADEVAEGLSVLARSGSREDRDYAVQVASFLDNLLAAATRSGSRMAVILTLPARVTERGVEWESRYRGGGLAAKVLEDLVRAVRRVNAALLEPVASGEFWRILRRRLFEWIDEDYGHRLGSELRSVYEQYRDVFGGGAGRVAGDAARMYPFHPYFVEALREVIERNEQLQKTRDALKLARRIVRRLHRLHGEGRVAEEMIMAWHLDPTVDEVGSMILSGPFAHYKTVVDVDLKRNVERLSEPVLGKLIAVSVFVRTFVYDSPKPLPQFPTPETVALMVYDPGLFQARRWLPPDVPALLEEMPGLLYYLWSVDNRYWFWSFANAVSMIDRRARELAETRGPQLLEELTRSEDYLAGLVTRRLARRRGALLGEKYRMSLFEEALVDVEVGPEDVPDEDRYRLVVAWRPREGGFEDVVTHSFRGGRRVQRTFRNSVVVLAPVEGLEERAVERYAWVKAAEEVEAELDAILEGAGLDPETRSAVRKAQATMVRNARYNVEVKLLEELLQGFNRVYYPSQEGVRAVDATRLGVTALCLAEKAERALQQEGKAVLDRLSFEYLLQLLEDAGAGLERLMLVREAAAKFAENPRLPMVPPALVADALLEGHRSGWLLVKRGAEVYHPAIVEAEECPSGGERPRGRVVDRLRPEDEVARVDAPEGLRVLLEYLAGLEGEREEPDGSIVVTRVRVAVEGYVVSLDEFRELASEDPGVARNAVFCVSRERRRPGLRLSVSPERLEAGLGEQVKITVGVEGVGGLDPGTVRLRVEAPRGVEARLARTAVRAGETVELEVTASEPGTHVVRVAAEPERGEPAEAAVVVHARGGVETVDCRELQGFPEARVREVMVEGSWRDAELFLEDVSRLGGVSVVSAVLEADGFELRVSGPKDADVVVETLKEVAGVVGRWAAAEPRVSVRLAADPPVEAGQVAAAALNLIGDVSCRARVEKR
ncbi:MAG: DUF499 domain-containing protein [Crenarchaeota archaeon]|nr:DUF499 domain-containing protein [Thermoproteota archaeon]